MTASTPAPASQPAPSGNGSAFDTLFPQAAVYAEWRRVSDTVREAPAPYHAGFHWTERHLQCLWFDERLRPAVIPLAGGEYAQVLDPGEWNLEAGPDFIGATLLVEPGRRQLRGDVEIHVRPSDWDAHRHADDPAYGNVVAHVTWFEGPPPHTLPEGIIALALAPPVRATPALSLDDIDLKAYPHAVLPATPRPCEVFLRPDPDRALALLRAAGEYRLRAKAQRLLTRLAQSGDRHQVFFEEVMAALGYKHNQAPFRALARLLPVGALGVSRESAFARLLGAARLLPQPDAAPDEEGRRFIRTLWDLWWRETAETLPDDAGWRLHNLRPQNAPVRRLAAAASLFSGLCTVRHELDRLSGERGAAWFARAASLFESRCRWPFWNARLAFSSKPDPQADTALLGASRTAAILANVELPLAAAEGRLPADVLNHLPPEDLSSPMRATALRLFGRDHNPALYAGDGLLLQGLIQIHLDFCINAKPGCEACALLDTLTTTDTGKTP